MNEFEDKPVHMMALANALRQSPWAVNVQDALADNQMGGEMRRSPWTVNLQAAPLVGPAIGHGMGGRVAYEHPVGDDSGLEFGVSGGYAQGRAGNTAISEGTLGGANLTYRNRGTRYGIEYVNGMTPDGKPNRNVMATLRSEF